MKKQFLFFCLLLVSFNVFPQKNSDLGANKYVLGNFETVLLLEKHIKLDAKLDTGATMSSLSAQDITFFDYNHKPWVQFTLIEPIRHQKVTFKKPLLRHVKILKREEERSTTLKKPEYSLRPVIVLSVCVGNKATEIEVNLISRTHFHYPLLLGSTALRKLNAVVDVNKDHIRQPLCQRNKNF